MIDLRPACRRLGELVAGIDDEQLDSGTPCPKYSVKDLLDHVDEGARGFAGVANATARTTGAGTEAGKPDSAAASDGDTGEALDFAGDWRGVLGRRLEVLGQAWSDPAAWVGEADLAGLELSNEEWGKIALTEVVVHGWDLSKATGLPFVLPEETVQACYHHVAGFLDAPPVPELWGAAVEVSVGASLMDRTVAIAGRRP